MAGPIYKLFIIRSFREAYYHLSDEERDQFWSRVGENETAVGSKGLIACDSRWSNESYANWGVIEYPDLQAVQQSTRANEKNQHFRYIEGETYLGTMLEGSQITQVDFPNPLYQLFLIKNHESDPWRRLPKEERDRLLSCVGESIEKHGGKMVIGCDINWANEEYVNFGVIAWPNHEAEQAHFKDLEEIGWHLYIGARTILGYQHVE